MTRRLDERGYVRLFSVGRNYRYEHVVVAEKALGRPLPKGVVIHHANEVKGDNRGENLVLCQDEAYHQLLHRRTRAFDECGHADWRQCNFCKGWSPPTEITVVPTNSSAHHKACRSAQRRKLYAQQRSC